MELENIPNLQTLDLLNPPKASTFWPRSDLEDAGVYLPRFLDIQLPEPAPIAYVGYDGESFAHDETGLASKALANLYDSLSEHGFVVRFEPTLANHVAGYVNSGMVFVETIDSSEPRLLKSRPQEEDLAANGYMLFLHAFRQWERSRNVSAAWKFLDRHPAFWTVNEDGGWHMSGGMSGANLFYYEKNGEDWAAVEAGEADPSDQVTRIPDPRLFISARNMEQVISALAMQVLSIHGLTREDEGGGFNGRLMS